MQQISTNFDGDDHDKEQQPIAGAESCPTTEVTDQQQSCSSTRPQQTRKQPAWMRDYAVSGINQPQDEDEDPLTYFAFFSDCDPVRFEDASKEVKWQQAMDEEIAAIERNHTWELTELPKGQKTIGVKWVYKTKLNENGEVDKYKVCLVAKGYKQEFGVDYKEVFAPVARHDTIRLVIALAAHNSWPIFQLDMKSAFLHGNLHEEVFVDQPPGYVKFGSEHKVYKLKKTLNGLTST